MTRLTLKNPPSTKGYEDRPDELPQRVYRSFDEIDLMPPDLRQCVHEFGYAIVKSCIQAGVDKPKNIRQLVHSIWLGARQPHQRTQYSNRLERPSVAAQIDWLLIQAGSGICADTLIEVLAKHNMVIVPTEPYPEMVAASMAEVTGHTELMTKAEKHRRRLRAAIWSAANRFWPGLHIGANAAPLATLGDVMKRP